jgi:hypothetical protein
MIEWIKSNKLGVIRGMFLVPIILVMIISISHVISWYDLANPTSWAIYLSIAIEIAAMSAISAASVRIRGFSVWFVFILVTFIQFIGNIYFCYSDIDVTTKNFKDWSDLTAPVFDMIGADVSNAIDQRRWLALIEGGLLPLISLTCLHFFIKYDGIDNIEPAKPKEVEETVFEKIVAPEKVEEVKVEVEKSIQPNTTTQPVEPPVIPSTPIQVPRQTLEPKQRQKMGLSNKMKKILGKL